MQTVDQRRLERIRSVTDNYFFWQGLRLVPMGAALLVVALRWTPWWPLVDPWNDLVLILVLAIGLTASWAIGSSYRRTFGDVRARFGAHERRDTLKWLVVYPVMVCALVIDGIVRPAVFVTGPVWGAATVAYWWSTGRGRPHYLVAAALFSIYGLLPILGLYPSGVAAISPFFALLGVVYMVGGVLDHFELKRLLGPVPPDGDQTTV
jgi:hypothetical protein